MVLSRLACKLGVERDGIIVWAKGMFLAERCGLSSKPLVRVLQQNRSENPALKQKSIRRDDAMPDACCVDNECLSLYVGYVCATLRELLDLGLVGHRWLST